MDLFFHLYGFGHYGYDGYGRGHWYGSNEKSRHSLNRENEAKKKFDAMRRTMEATMIETTINEAREEGSNSHLQKLPNDALNNVYGYLLGKEFENDENAKISKQISEAIPRIDHRARTVKKVGEKYLQFGVDFSDLSLFEPGNKITIPLTLPNFHLTQPCFRDLKKHVVKSSGWDLKRVVCTPAEKKLHKVTRKSNAYFVNAIYKVPGTAKKKSRKKASTSNTNVSLSAAYASVSAPAAFASASAPNAKKRAAPAPATKAPKKPAYKANPAATAALQAALASAQDGDGVVDPECLKKALSFGFSKAFIDAKVDEQEALNVKPAAKKMKN
mmetsp:Transcript_13492/g.19213  ORF Transcript_13492/g.19213 Transcript_13492/m.19213 type:complete len:329 (+) Transcript_13492:63-1049(+)